MLLSPTIAELCGDTDAMLEEFAKQGEPSNKTNVTEFVVDNSLLGDPEGPQIHYLHTKYYIQKSNIDSWIWLGDNRFANDDTDSNDNSDNNEQHQMDEKHGRDEFDDSGDSLNSSIKEVAISWNTNGASHEQLR